MERQLISLIETLIARQSEPELNKDWSDFQEPRSQQQNASIHPLSEAPIEDPLHRRVRRETGTESATWDYSEYITDGYKGDDGGHISNLSKILLLPSEDDSRTEAVIDADDRTKVVNSHEYPWRMIVSLEMVMPGETIRHGTGFMVGPNMVLTAGHCIYEPRYGGWADRVVACPGLTGAAAPYGHFTSSEMSTSLGWVDLQDHKYDYAFVELSDHVGKKTGWFSLGVLPTQKTYRSKINVCGYPSDLNESLLFQWHSGGRVGSVESQKLYYEADTYGGTSGGPVWLSNSDGSQVVVGVHAYGTKLSEHLGKPHNSATRVIPEVARGKESFSP